MRKIFLLVLLLVFPLYGEGLSRQSHPIRGGDRTPFGSMKSVVLVSKGDGNACTGTIVHRNWILTAAHCSLKSDLMEPSGIRSVTFGWKTSYEETISRIGRVIAHPEYESRDGRSYRYDVALIELLDPVPEGFDPLPLMSRGLEDEMMRPGMTGMMVGHGVIPGGEYMTWLHQAEVPVKLPGPCRSDWGGLPEIVLDSTLCAGTRMKRLTSGDSGGPLLISTGRKQFVQAGIAFRSTGGLGSDGLPRLFGLYTRASSIYEWVQSYLSSSLSAPVILTHVFSGDLNGNDSWTEAVITNQGESPCSVNLKFSLGTEEAPPVYFDEMIYPKNLLSLSLPAFATRSVNITSPNNEFIHGSLYIESNCSFLNVQGRYLIQNRREEIQEVFSVSPQAEQDWFSRGGGCISLASKFGNGRDVGLAFVTAKPGDVAPPGTMLEATAFNWDAVYERKLESVPVTGRKTALNPWKLSEPKLLQLCLTGPNLGHSFKLAIIAIGAKATRGGVQYFSEDLMPYR